MRFLAEVHDAPGTPINTHPSQDELQAILDRRIGGIRVVHSHWLTTFEVRHARVPAYRWGRVFLAGDAAHIHSPAGGQGMNTGMQDAFNLAWKLSAVINGDAGETLLNSYEGERASRSPTKSSRFTDRFTKAGTLSGVPRRIRDVVVQILSRSTRGSQRVMAETRRGSQRRLPAQPDRGGQSAEGTPESLPASMFRMCQMKQCRGSFARRAASA